MFDVKVPDPKSATGTKRRRKIPRSGVPATIKLVEGTVWLGLFALFSSWYSVEFALSDGFLKYSFLRRYFLLSMRLIVGCVICNRLVWHIGSSTTEYGKWRREHVFCLELALMGINQMAHYGGTELRTSRPMPSKPLKTIKNYLKHGIKIPINGWRITYIWESRHEGRNLGLEVRWQHLLHLLSGMDSIRDIISLLFLLVWFRLAGNVHCFFVVDGLTIDYRRHLRPFFLDSDLSTPTKYKKYYDFTSWLVIISTYNYIVQPFIILSIWDSLRLWARLKVPAISFWAYSSSTCTSSSSCRWYFSIVTVRNGLTQNWQGKYGDEKVCQNIRLWWRERLVRTRGRGCIWFHRCRNRLTRWESNGLQTWTITLDDISYYYSYKVKLIISSTFYERFCLDLQVSVKPWRFGILIGRWFDPGAQLGLAEPSTPNITFLATTSVAIYWFPVRPSYLRSLSLPSTEICCPRCKYWELRRAKGPLTTISW